jgi:hypothetical protein
MRRRRGELPLQAKGLIEIAYRNSERLGRLINDILDITGWRRAYGICRGPSSYPLVETAVELTARMPNPCAWLVLHQARRGQGPCRSRPHHPGVDQPALQCAKFQRLRARPGPMMRRGIISVSRWPTKALVSGEFRDRIFEICPGGPSDSRQRGGTGLDCTSPRRSWRNRGEHRVREQDRRRTLFIAIYRNGERREARDGGKREE